METKTPSLELKLEDGSSLNVEVVSYHLKLSDRLHIGTQGKMHKMGTFKIHSSAYKSWGAVKTIKYALGECIVLTDYPPKLTPRTITYKVRHDF
jgi:hypothetical protein